MSDKPENPPAFPTKGGMSFYFPEELRGQIEEVAKQVAVSNEGMTLRDYFAAAALPAIVRNHQGSRTGDLTDTIARGAYTLDDAMLTERARRKP